MQNPTEPSRAPETQQTLIVRQARMEVPDVLSLVLEDPFGMELPPWEPGAHLDLVLPSGLTRQYSLCSDPADLTSYRVAVLNEPQSRGGSREVHETALVGRSVTVRGPRNHFSLVEAPSYLFIAGGIGVTPILPMIGRAQASQLPWKLLYGGRSRARMAFLTEIERFSGGLVEIVPEDERGFPDLEGAIEALSPGGAIYACGPTGMLTAIERICEQIGLHDSLHFERFSAAPVEEQPELHEATEFQVVLARSGIELTVAEDQTILQVIRDQTTSVLFSCEEGYCGTCEVRVLEGVPDHRDTILSDAEHAANRSMMICVGRSLSPRLVLDL